MGRVSPINSLLISLLFLLAGCPHTNYYQPVSSWEKQASDRANRNVFPDDVRNDLAGNSSTVVAWPGVVLNSEFIEHPDNIEVQFVLEHHYYDWLEDHSVQKEKIFLSPRGEGQFKTSWFVKKESNTDEMRKAASPGNLVIVYGTPERVNDDRSISLKSVYIRGIDKQWYRTDVLDYGRPGEPGKVINVPLR
ncbi:MAG: hypothetical protein MPW14_07480 [Candidatus Manganitrophus sp.]|nr:hypothetical protein [Candidatus Manganitrophus sp.]MDC4222721.1 hypothetical protein [Candidatus Manganitrophus sp.]WDT71145.1 MAG: hypothetical protein MPW17_20810 [Candidatus Manganitrophus sp.]WDT81560.1 MAG: hypothetical protein MPW14_07480 [Candidatus Manganitrophus sp.]